MTIGDLSRNPRDFDTSDDDATLTDTTRVNDDEKHTTPRGDGGVQGTTQAARTQHSLDPPRRPATPAIDLYRKLAPKMPQHAVDRIAPILAVEGFQPIWFASMYEADGLDWHQQGLWYDAHGPEHAAEDCHRTAQMLFDKALTILREVAS